MQLSFALKDLVAARSLRWIVLLSAPVIHVGRRRAAVRRIRFRAFGRVPRRDAAGAGRTVPAATARSN